MSSKDKRWLTVSLTLKEKKALIKSATVSKRTIKQQAAVYIIESLQRDGFIPGCETDCHCPHCGGRLTEDIVANALGTEPQQEANQGN